MNDKLREKIFNDEIDFDYVRLSCDEIIALKNYISMIESIHEIEFDRRRLLQQRINKAIEELDKYINRCTNEGGDDYDVCLMALNCMKKAKSILSGENNE